ncbi:MAG: hypothetical protein P8X42_13515 [Calditrichaceae bacterium]
MKRYINFLIIMTMFFATTDVFAKWDQKDLKKALKCYEKTLSHDNEGLVISSIRNIMKLMVTYPQLDFSDAKKKLDKLSPPWLVRKKVSIRGLSFFIKNARIETT